MMRGWLLLVASSCVSTHTSTVVDPVLLAPASRPIPEGLVASDLERVEVRACGTEYQGLDDLIARAQIDRDLLVQVTVDVEYHRRFETIGSRAPQLVEETRCYVLRGFRASLRAPL